MTIITTRKQKQQKQKHGKGKMTRFIKKTTTKKTNDIS